MQTKQKWLLTRCLDKIGIYHFERLFLFMISVSKSKWYNGLELELRKLEDSWKFTIFEGNIMIPNS